MVAHHQFDLRHNLELWKVTLLKDDLDISRMYMRLNFSAILPRWSQREEYCGYKTISFHD